MAGQYGDKRLRICAAAKARVSFGSNADVSFGSPSTVTSVVITGQSGDRSWDDSCGPRARCRYGRKMNSEILLSLGLVSEGNPPATGRI